MHCTVSLVLCARNHPSLEMTFKLVYQHLPHPLSHDHLLFVTILLVGFFGLLHFGELVQPDMPHLRSISKISWRHDVQLSATSLSFSIPRSKTDHFFEGDRVVIQKSSLALDDPLALFQCSGVS